MFASIGALFKEYPWLSAAVLWVFAALVHSLPVPLSTERWYGALFNFLQTCGANLSKIGQKQNGPNLFPSGPVSGGQTQK